MTAHLKTFAMGVATVVAGLYVAQWIAQATAPKA